MALITKKKIQYQVSENLRSYLKRFGRQISLPLHYQDLLRYNNAIPLYDQNGKDTLWETVFYPQNELSHLNNSLKKIYSMLTADGDVSVIQHLYIDRVDICPFGNSKPFRIRIVNNMNDNFDYYYVKTADASRVYGLELEHLISPNKIKYLIYKNTLIEEHIAGLPGDQFFKFYLSDPNLNKIRIAKEFVKFNERCFYRLLGDMHSSNFVIDITPDFEEVHYRIRSIDFDQQSFEGRKAVYMPQFFKQNNPIIELGLKLMTPESMHQYQLEERSLMIHRIKSSRYEVKELLDSMVQDELSTPKHIGSLRKELAKHHNDDGFLNCQTMGEIVKLNLKMLVRKREPTSDVN
jgi:hypothetical protein